MEKSFIVQAKDLEQALDKASIVLHWPHDRIAYELLQVPQPGRYGHEGKLCKLRVTPVALSAEELCKDNEGDIEDRCLDAGLHPPPDSVLRLPSKDFLTVLNAAKARVKSLPEPDYRRFASASDHTGAAGRSLREIQGNVDTDEGSIRFDGDILVRGNVLKGCSVCASGSITVCGEVDTAFLDAGRDIMVGAGMLGTARTEFGSISCRFAQGAHLKSLFGDVEIEESAMHAQIRAGHRVIVHGTVLGGVCYGESQVYVRVAGSPAGVNTVLMAGRNRAIYDQIEQLRHRAVRHAQKLRQYEGVRLDLSLEESGERMEPDDRKALWMTVLRKERIEQDLVRMSRKKAHLLGMINADRGSRISIEGAVYPKTRISIDEVSTDIEHLTQFATFSKDYEIGDLRMTPFS